MPNYFNITTLGAFIYGALALGSLIFLGAKTVSNLAIASAGVAYLCQLSAAMSSTDEASKLPAFIPFTFMLVSGALGTLAFIIHVTS